MKICYPNLVKFDPLRDLFESDFSNDKVAALVHMDFSEFGWKEAMSIVRTLNSSVAEAQFTFASMCAEAGKAAAMASDYMLKTSPRSGYVVAIDSPTYKVDRRAQEVPLYASYPLCW